MTDLRPGAIFHLALIPSILHEGPSVNRIHAALFLLTLLAACAGESEGVQAAESALSSEDAQASESSAARAATPDSLVEALLGDRDPNPAPAPTSPRLPPQEQANQPLLISEMGYHEGSPDAPVKVLELSDFGCGYCRLFHQQTFPTLREIYIEAGLVEWKHVPYVLGIFPNGLEAARAAECAGEQDGFFSMQKALYDSQAGWRASQDPRELFSGLAEREGLDVERFRSCVYNGWQDGRVRANSRLGQQVGARGTPTFLIDGQLLAGALPLEDFREVLDTALKLKAVTPPPR
jgi:protein-disulfide isomerase